MGFLKRLRGEPAAPEKPITERTGPIDDWSDEAVNRRNFSVWLVDATSGGYVKVVGTSQYQGTLKIIAGGIDIDGPRKRDHRAGLMPEPTNPYDPDAVRVVIANGGAHVGYLGRQDAKAYRPVIDRLAAVGRLLAPAASLHSGGPNATIGVRLHMAKPEVLMRELDENPELLEPA